MSEHWCEKFYFQRGDLVLQIGDTIFKVHRDILARHSRFFREMFSIPTVDDKEGTEEKPLSLPIDLCSASIFTVLCDFLYPEHMGQFPEINFRNLERWEAVLKATAALQMEDTQKYILEKLGKDVPNLKSDVAKVLRLALDYEEELGSQLLLGPLYILAYRRQSLTPREIAILGERTTSLINYTRESVRACFFLNRARSKIQVHSACGEKESCRPAIFRQIIANMQRKASITVDDSEPDIFHIGSEQAICALCSPQRSNIARTLRASLLDEVVEKCFMDMTSMWREETGGGNETMSE